LPPFQNKSYEQYSPKGEFLQAGIDVSVVATDDLIYGKIVARLLLWEIFKQRAYLINTNVKYLYDEVAGVSLWLKQYEDGEFADKLERINRKIQEDFAKLREATEKSQKTGSAKPDFGVDYLHYADEILLEVFNLMSRLGWSPVSKTKIATLLQDQSFKDDIEEAMGTIEKSDIEEQKQTIQQFVAQEVVEGASQSLSNELMNPSLTVEGGNNPSNSL
jgi:hypothetical protein